MISCQGARMTIKYHPPRARTGLAVEYEWALWRCTRANAHSSGFNRQVETAISIVAVFC